MLTRSLAHSLTLAGLAVTTLAVTPAFAQRDGGPEQRELPAFVPGSMWVKLDQRQPETHDATIRVVKAISRTEVTKTFWLVPGLHLVSVPVGDEIAMSRFVRELPGIEYATMEAIGRTSDASSPCIQDASTCTDPKCVNNGQYWVNSVNLDDVWADYAGLSLPTSIVAIMDTGVNYNHPDLSAQMWVNPGEIPANGIDDDANGIIDDVHGAAFVDPPVYDPCNSTIDNCDPENCSTCEPGPGDPTEAWLNVNQIGWVNCGEDVSMGPGIHGTACASIIAASANNLEVRGFNCGIRVMAVRLMHRCYAIGGYRESNFVDGLQYAAENGAKVISNSTFLSPIVVSEYGEDGWAMINAIEALATYDVVFVQSAGNNLQLLDNPLSPILVYVPQQIQLSHVAVVGASDASDNLALFPTGGGSNWSGELVTIFAPGHAIPTFTDNAVAHTDGKLYGTSFSTPIIAAAIAMYRSLNPTASAADCVNAVTNTARLVPQLDGLCKADGILDVDALLNY